MYSNVSPEPVFIDAQLIPDGSDPNDAKLYFFLRERLTDHSGNTKSLHTLLARVCPVSGLCALCVVSAVVGVNE